MSRESFQAEFRTLQNRVRDKSIQDWNAFVASQTAAEQVAVASVYELARRHGVRVEVSSVGVVASMGRRRDGLTQINARVVGE